MRGLFNIDGKDALSLFGIFITEGGHNGVMSYPSLKTPEQSNNWAEHDGIEVDTSDAKLNTKEAEIKFAATGDYKIGDFISLISDKAYHIFNFVEIGYSCKLRLVTEVNSQLLIGVKEFSLKFADDFPLDGYTYMEPLSNTVPIQGYELDGVDFSAYGIRVLEGSEAQVLKCPAVKKNMIRNIITQSGAIYDDKNVVYQQKEVVLNCCLIANSFVEFWRNYNAFLYDLVRIVDVEDENGIEMQTAERSLFVDNLYEAYSCYYKESKVSLLDPNGNIWCKFTLTLVFTSFRIGEDEYLLASEDGALIETEDGEFLIDLKYGS